MLDHSDSRCITQRNLQVIAQEAQYLNKLPSDQVLSLVLSGRVEHFPAETIILQGGFRHS